MKVKVYYNLRKHCFSVVSLEKEDYGRVIDHVDSLSLEDVSFKVSEAGRNRVLQTQQKNVHAYVIGTVSNVDPNWGTEVTYNPYKYSGFVNKLTKEPIHSAKKAYLSNRRVFAHV